MPHIFVSYSRDDKEYVLLLSDSLKKHGLPVWIDARVEHGTNWAHEIWKHLDTCGAFIVVMTPSAHKSEWVQKEVKRAKANKKDIYPLLLDGDGWKTLQKIQYADVKGNKLPPEDYYEKLVDSLYVNDSQGLEVLDVTKTFDRIINSGHESLLSPDEILNITLALAKSDDIQERFTLLREILPEEDIASILVGFNVILTSSSTPDNDPYITNWLSKNYVSPLRVKKALDIVFELINAKSSGYCLMIRTDLSKRMPAEMAAFYNSSFSFAPEDMKQELCKENYEYLNLQVDMHMTHNILFAYMDDNFGFPAKMMMEREKLRLIRSTLRNKGELTMASMNTANPQNASPLYVKYAPEFNKELRNSVFKLINNDDWFPTMAIIESISIETRMYSEELEKYGSENLYNGFHAVINLMLATLNYARPDLPGKLAGQGIVMRLSIYLRGEDIHFVETFMKTNYQLFQKDVSGKRLMTEMIEQFNNRFKDDFLKGAKIAQDVILAYSRELQKAGIDLTDMSL